MKISEASEFLGISTPKLIDELMSRFPEKDWKPGDEIPEELVEAIDKHSQNYQQQQQLVTSSENELKTVHLESIEYGILEALEQFKLEHLELRASIGAVRDWEKYKQTYERTLAEIYQREISDRTSQTEGIVQSLLAARDEGKEASNKLMGELRRTQLTIQSRMDKLRKLAG